MLHRTMPLAEPARPPRFRPEALFRPRSVALIGDGSAAADRVLHNLAAGRFHGRLMAVGWPAEGLPTGVEPVADAAALPVPPDLAIVAAAGPAAAAALAALGRVGAGLAVVTGTADEAPPAARAAGLRLVGPGSFGVALPGSGLNATTGHLPPPAGRVALVAQSAALCRTLLDWAGPNGIGFSAIVGMGERVDLGFAAVLDWLARDGKTGLVVLDVRRIIDARAFLSAARACARLRPVVAIRTGARLADPSGSGAAFHAALRRAGVVSVRRLDDLLAAIETLHRGRPARGEALAIVGNTVGASQLAADAALAAEIPLARLSPPTQLALRLLLGGPDAGRDLLPADGRALVHVPPDPPLRLAEAAAMIAGAPEVGGIVLVHAPDGPGDATMTAALAAGARSLRVPVLVAAMGETTGARHRRELAAVGIPVFAAPEQAVRGFGHLLHQLRAAAAAHELPPSAVLPIAPDRAAVSLRLQALRAERRLWLTQDEALAVLAAYGVPLVPTRLAATPAAAATAAAQLGFPVVLKLRRLGPPDPAAASGLAFDLADAASVQHVAATMLQSIDVPDRDGPGLLVQAQVARSRELRIQVEDDPMVGLTIGFGQGGTAAPLLDDIAFDLPPLNLPLARALIASTRVGATLGALRDRPAADAEAVAETLVRVSQLLVDVPEIAALEINPLFADAGGVLAGDAWMRLRPPGELGRLAIAPYPGELVTTATIAGDPLTIRPIRPEDAEAYAELFRHVPPEDLRLRFFVSLREVPPEQIARMTQIDYDREMAFVAVRDASGEALGGARLVCEPGESGGEFAVLVRRDMKGTGLATLLMHRLIDWAQRQGLSEITGQVLAENRPMLGLAEHLGFTLRHDPDDPGVVDLTLALPAQSSD